MSETQFNNIANILVTYSSRPARTMIDDKMSEESLMSSLFSNSFDASIGYVEYFLKNRYANVYNDVQEKSIFFNFDMQKQTGNVIPEKDKNIVDLDVSLYNKESIIKYYFLLDLLSEFYGYLSTTSTSSRSSTANVIRIKCRYYIDDGEWKLYRKSDSFVFDIDYSYASDNTPRFTISHVSNNEDVEMVKNMCLEFQADIIKHLGYINKPDVVSANAEYLNNIKAFYKFCRLKLIYYTLLCCAQKENSVNDFIQKILSFCFINLKNFIMLNNVENKSIITTNQLMISTQKLKELNSSIEKKRDKIKRQKKKSDILKDNSLKELFYFIIAATVVCFIVMIFIYASSGLQSPNFGSDIILLAVVIAIYMFVHYVISLNVTEAFVSYPTFANESTNLKYWWKFENDLKDSVQNVSFTVNEGVDGMNDVVYEVKNDMNTIKLATAAKYPDETTFKLRARVNVEANFSLSFWCSVSGCCNKILSLGPDIYFSIVKDVYEKKDVVYVNNVSDNREYQRYNDCGYYSGIENRWIEDTRCQGYLYNKIIFDQLNPNNLLPAEFNKFLHYTLTYNNTSKSLKFYMNSEMKFEKTLSSALTTGSMNLGLFNNQSNINTQISYADLRIYDKVLTYEEIYSIYNIEYTNYVLSSNYVFPIITYPKLDHVLIKESNNIDFYLKFDEPGREYTVVLSKDIVCDILMVGGGGGAGKNKEFMEETPSGGYYYHYYYGTTGGGGGVVEIKNYTLPAGTYKFSIGKGGVAVNGENTVISRTGWGTVAAGGGGKGAGSDGSGKKDQASVHGNHGNLITTNSSLNFPNSSGAGGGGGYYHMNNGVGGLNGKGGSGNSISGNGSDSSFNEYRTYFRGHGGGALKNSDVGKGIVSTIISQHIPLYLGYGGDFTIDSNVDAKYIFGKGGGIKASSYFQSTEFYPGGGGLIILKYTAIQENVFSFSIPVNVVNDSSVKPIKIPYNANVYDYIMTDDTYYMVFTSNSYTVNITRDTYFDILIVGGGGSANYVYGATAQNASNGSGGQVIEKKMQLLKSGTYIFSIGKGGITGIAPTTGTPNAAVSQATSTVVTTSDGTEGFNLLGGRNGGNGNQKIAGIKTSIIGTSISIGGNDGTYGKGGNGNTGNTHNHEYGGSGAIILRFSAYMLKFNELVQRQATLIDDLKKAKQDADDKAKESSELAISTDAQLKILQGQLDALQGELAKGGTETNAAEAERIRGLIGRLEKEITDLTEIKNNAEKIVEGYEGQRLQQEILKAIALEDELQIKADIDKYADLLKQVQDIDTIYSSNLAKQQLKDSIGQAGKNIANSVDSSLISQERSILYDLSMKVAEKKKIVEKAKKDADDAKKVNDTISLSMTNVSTYEGELDKASSAKSTALILLAQQESDIIEAQALAEAKQEIADSRKRTFADLKKDLDKLEAQMSDTNKISAILQVQGLQKSIDTINADTNKFLQNAQEEYDKLSLERQTEIDILKGQLDDIKKVVEQVRKEIEQHVQNTLNDRNASLDIQKELDILSEEILMEQMSLLQYKYVATVLSMDTSVQNISTKIALNINNTAVAIANSIIISSIHKEIIDFENEKTKIDTSAHMSSQDIEIKERDIKIMVQTIKLIANILLVSTIITVFYTRGQFSGAFLFYILVVAYVVLIIFYIVQVIRIVRTKAKNIYWRKPASMFE